ncbi:MAG TPA: hypothetical protein VGH32_07695 [Pirellulales bacterium]
MTLLPGPSSLQRYRRPEHTRSVAVEQRADGFEVVLGVGVVQGVVAGGQTRNLSPDEDALGATVAKTADSLRNHCFDIKKEAPLMGDAGKPIEEPVK